MGIPDTDIDIDEEDLLETFLTIVITAEDHAVSAIVGAVLKDGSVVVNEEISIEELALTLDTLRNEIREHTGI